MRSPGLERLDLLLQSKTTVNEPEFKAALTRLSLEIKERLKKGSPSSVSFFLSAVRALCRVKGTAHAELRMTCLFDSGFFLISNGLGTEALAAVRELEYLATRENRKMWIRRASNLSGIVNADLGNVADAVIQYCHSLTLAREIQDSAGVVSVLANLGAALNYGGLYREAIPCLERAITLVSDPGMSVKNVVAVGMTSAEFRCAALTNLAQSYLYLGEFERGFGAISECLAHATTPTDAVTASSRAIREFTYVQLALELGKLESAKKHSELCEKYGALGGLRGRHVAEICRGLCEVYGGDAEQGLRILEGLLEGEFRTNSAQISVLIALVKACEQISRPEKALHYMNSLLDRIVRTREKGILALLEVPGESDGAPNYVPESDDLRALQHKELQLRTQVAERDAISVRIEMLDRLAVAADLKEDVTGEHGYRVGRLCSLLAEDLNWTKDACVALELAARVHDIGKIGVPDRILLTSRELLDVERHFVSAHATVGAELLAKSNVPQLRLAEDIARYHHEWWDGTGYPSKLAGKRIPIHARIVALADVFDALTHGRPYAERWPCDKAVAEIGRLRGQQFDPDLTDAFLQLITRLNRDNRDLDVFLGRAGKNSRFLQARSKIRQMLEDEREQERGGLTNQTEIYG